MAPRYDELTGMSDADLISAYNDAAPNVMVGLEWFRFELWRREAAKQTKWVIWLTFVVMVFTAANVVLAAAVLAKARVLGGSGEGGTQARNSSRSWFTPGEIAMIA